MAPSGYRGLYISKDAQVINAIPFKMVKIKVLVLTFKKKVLEDCIGHRFCFHLISILIIENKPLKTIRTL